MDDVSLGRLIGRGAQADVYLHEGQAIKLFHENRTQENAMVEADTQQRVFNAGIPVPRVYGVATLGGRPAIAMELVEGPTLASLMLKDMERAAEYLKTTVELQLRLHSLPGEGLPSQREKLRYKITATPLLPRDLKQKLLGQLEAMAHDSVVCHGDFHPYNMIQTAQGVKIIDWADATCGAAMADACRSYLLYRLYSKEAAAGYLQLYCAMAKVQAEDVLTWMPVIAGARLQETGLGDDESLLLRLAEGARE